MAEGPYKVIDAGSHAWTVFGPVEFEYEAYFSDDVAQKVADMRNSVHASALASLAKSGAVDLTAFAFTGCDGACGCGDDLCGMCFKRLGAFDSIIADLLATRARVRELEEKQNEEQDAPRPIGRCPGCGTPVYSELGHCGVCRG